jgi:hypothetical protein
MSLVLQPLRLLGFPVDPAMDLMDLFQTGRRWEKAVASLGLVGVVSGIASAAISDANDLPRAITTASFGLAAVGLFSLSTAVTSFEWRKREAQTQEVAQLQERARAEPAEPQLAWDLARIKLESYLDRNLRQVSSIYYLTLLVMLFGMGLISVGIWNAINDPTAIQPGALAALAGVIVEIIGGTFLLIYRSTMGQAKEYVIVLERINAVGMSINILEGIESATEMRDNARVQLSTSLLSMYATVSVPPPRSARGTAKAS